MASPTKLPSQAVVKALQTLSDEKTKKLVFQFGVDPYILENIETRYNAGSRNIPTIQAWLDRDTEANWEKLVSGLNEIEMKVLARDVASKYCPAQLSSLSTGPVPTSQPAGKSLQPPVPFSAKVVEHCLSASDKAITVNTSSVEEVKATILELEERFSDLISDTGDEMCEKENRDRRFLNRFRTRLLVLPVTRKPIHVKFFLESEDDILAAKNTKKILAILCRYWNYRNYEILFHIITRFCDDPLKKSMLEYEVMINKFEAATTVDVYITAISAGKKLSLAFSEMVVKLDKAPSECTLQEVRKLRDEIAEASSLCSHSVYIESESVHCVVVVLKIPSSAVEWVVEAMTPDFMSANHLTEVVVDEHHLIKHLTGHPTVTTDHPSIETHHDTVEAHHPTLEPDHPMLETDHPTAKTDHSTANFKAKADHSTAEANHPTLETEQPTLATTDSKAETDHLTFKTYQSTAETDHSTAKTDHSTTETDHPTAAKDHSTAHLTATDHLRVEKIYAPGTDGGYRIDAEGNETTQYQGSARVYREFCCLKCNRRWSSWANIGQECKDCMTMVYPYRPDPWPDDDSCDSGLPDDDNYGSGLPHRSDLCEKCKKLGRNCRSPRY